MLAGISAINGDQVVPTGPQGLDPILKAAPEKGWVDAIDQRTQPTRAGDTEMERRKAARKRQMMLTPGSDVIEIIARRNGRAGHQQQHLRQGVGHTRGITVVVDL